MAARLLGTQTRRMGSMGACMETSSEKRNKKEKGGRRWRKEGACFHHYSSVQSGAYSQSEAVVLSSRRGGGTILIQRGPCWWCCLLAHCELSWRAVVMACAKRQNLPFAAKLEIINRVERGEKKSDVAAAYKIPRSTLSTILKIRAKSDKRPGARGARRVRTAVYEDVSLDNVEACVLSQAAKSLKQKKMQDYFVPK
ncbi:hypothetical protein HPB49_016257 [Dermacentor silvarum]|uniref:Uncharacterized protein n=1 Tax=Dermacentor silvarum TaxID=543639 RepID=A0ACB8CY23_DERSI|nr:hypothetical protein HPB49_016257 [Dermacentor silvarum]